MSPRGKGIVTGSLALTMLLGTLNSIIKKNKLPSFRFYFGSGVLWLFLIGIGEFEEEISRSIALALVVFSVLGEGGGVIDHFMGTGTAGKTLDTTPPQHTDRASILRPTGGGNVLDVAVVSRDNRGMNAVMGFDGTFPVKPVTPTSVTFQAI